MVASKYFVSRGPINLYIPHEYWMSDELDLIRSNPTSSSIHVGHLEITSPHHYSRGGRSLLQSLFTAWYC